MIFSKLSAVIFRARAYFKREIAAGAVLKVIALSLCSAGIFPIGKAAGEMREAPPILAEVNRVPIREEAVEEALRAYLRQIGHRELSAERMSALRNEILERLIEEELVYQEGAKKGLAAGDDEIKAEAARLRNRFSSEEDFEAALSKEKLTPEKVEAGLRRFIVIRKMWDFLASLADEGKQEWLKQIRENSEIKVYRK